MDRRGWQVGGGRCVELDCARIMAIVNVTPDSFSDGGLHLDAAAAIDRALQCVDEGADIIDIGGESTRPGAVRIDEQEQIRRVVPVIEGLVSQRDVIISVDTTLSAVAANALDAGAHIVNDVSAGLEDPEMLAMVAQRRAGYVLMHRLAAPGDDSYSDAYERSPEYGDVVGEVGAFLAERLDAAQASGIADESIVVDPGLGFGKSIEQNIALMRSMDAFDRLGAGVLSAASRKSFVGRLSGESDAAKRQGGSVAVSIFHWMAGVRLFRVHDVKLHREALAMVSALA